MFEIENWQVALLAILALDVLIQLVVAVKRARDRNLEEDQMEMLKGSVRDTQAAVNSSQRAIDTTLTHVLLRLKGVAEAQSLTSLEATEFAGWTKRALATLNEAQKQQAGFLAEVDAKLVELVPPKKLKVLPKKAAKK